MDIGEGGLPQIVKEEPREWDFSVNFDCKRECVHQENNRRGCLELMQDDVKLYAENSDSSLVQHSISKLINEELSMKDDNPKYLLTKAEIEDENLLHENVKIESIKKEQTDNEASLSSDILIQDKITNENPERLKDFGSIQMDETKMAAFQCNVCLKSFKRLDSLKCHQRIHTGEKPYLCEVCSCRFAFNYNFKKHMMIHANPCKICFESFFHIDALLNHEMKHYCKVCSRVFADISYTAKHEKKHSLVKSFHCEICSKSFCSKASLIKHQKNHTRGNTSETSNQIHLLQQHQIVHKKKEYSCDICLKSFNYIFSLKTHLMSHTGEKPFLCKFCSKSFIYNNSLLVHEKRHTGEKPFSCLVCSKSFIVRTELARHHRTHTGEKPFQCKMCSKSFSEKSSLARHEKLHFADYCHICLKSFKCSSTFEAHLCLDSRQQ